MISLSLKLHTRLYSICKRVQNGSKKIEAVKNWTTPKMVTDVRSFLGFTNHYQRFINTYAKVAKPLNSLVSGHNANRMKALVEWTEECQITFENLKDLCTSTPILAYADYKRPFQLQTDASDLSLDAVLYQKDNEGHKRVIAYASRSLRHTECNYCKVLLLAFRWSCFVLLFLISFAIVPEVSISLVMH